MAAHPQQTLGGSQCLLRFMLFLTGYSPYFLLKTFWLLQWSRSPTRPLLTVRRKRTLEGRGWRNRLGEVGTSVPRLKLSIMSTLFGCLLISKSGNGYSYFCWLDRKKGHRSIIQTVRGGQWRIRYMYTRVGISTEYITVCPYFCLQWSHSWI